PTRCSRSAERPRALLSQTQPPRAEVPNEWHQVSLRCLYRHLADPRAVPGKPGAPLQPFAPAVEGIGQGRKELNPAISGWGSSRENHQARRTRSITKSLLARVSFVRLCVLGGKRSQMAICRSRS